MTQPESIIKRIQAHYEKLWHAKPKVCSWRQGPFGQLPAGFSILAFPPGKHKMWTYATCGMSLQGDSNRLELHLFSPSETDVHVELLTCVAHYHLTGAYIDLGHTVNFGRPWLPGSRCDHGLVSLPYLDGPDLEWLETEEGKLRFLWLIPITPEETEFGRRNGPEPLEKIFDRSNFNYLDPLRKSVV